MAKIPDQIDKYKIEELVAAGGMGEVFKGLHPTLNRPVILKKLTLRGNPVITERFRREARILMDFRNDNIVDVQDHFVQGRSHYIVMEYIDGQSVKELLDEQRYLDNWTAALISLETAKALQYAHSKGVVHRDIKPGNILISRKGEVKLADFGIASSSGSGDDALTEDGTTLGTPAYMAPEQFENSRTVDYRADLYSLGVMMYEMLTGLKPFPGGFTPETIRMIQKGRYKNPRSINPAIAPELQKIIRSLMKPRPEARCGEIERIVGQLESWLGRYHQADVSARLSAMITGEEIPAVGRKKRHRKGVYTASAIMFLAAAGLLTAYCGLTQFHKLILYPAEYGRIRIQADSAYPPEARLFIDDGGKIPEIDIAVRFFPSGRSFRSPALVLPAGKYRLKTATGGRLIWTSFTVMPWSGKKVVTLIKPMPPDPAAGEISLSAEIHDAETGRDLRDISAIEIFREGKFIPAEGMKLLSGEVHHFRVSAPDYMSQEYILKLEKDQLILHFQIELITEE